MTERERSPADPSSADPPAGESPAVPAAPVPSDAAGPFPDPIDQLIPFGSICTFSGNAGVGKTAFLAGMIAAVQRGGTIFGYQTTAVPIAVLALDRPWRDHAPWFQKAGCAPFPYRSLRDEEYNWEVFHDRKHVPATFGTLLDEMALAPGTWVIVDPIPLFLPGRLHDYKDMAIAMGLLDQQLKPRQLTLLGICHTSKPKTSLNERYLRPEDRILGSTALIGYSETTFFLLSPEEADAPHYRFGYRGHQFPQMTFDYKRDPATGIFVPKEALEVINDEEAALALLPTEPDASLPYSVWTEYIRRALSCSARAAQGLISQLLKAQRVYRPERGRYARSRPH